MKCKARKNKLLWKSGYSSVSEVSFNVGFTFPLILQMLQNKVW
jgi:hypothetical protein